MTKEIILEFLTVVFIITIFIFTLFQVIKDNIIINTTNVIVPCDVIHNTSGALNGTRETITKDTRVTSE